MMMDHADAAWVGHVRAVLWGCKTVPCVSPCVHVFFGDDKFLLRPCSLPRERCNHACPNRLPALVVRLVRLGSMRLATRAANLYW